MWRSRLRQIECGVLLLLAVSTLMAQAQQPKPASDPWRQLAFMLGDWTASGTKEQSEAKGGFSLKPDLDGKILVRRNFAEYPAREAGKPPLRHEDLMIVYPSGSDSQYATIYFDNEGHVINYVLTCDEKRSSVRLESTGPEKAPRFRLDYLLKPDSTLEITFSIAQPGDTFKVYTTGTAHKQR